MRRVWATLASLWAVLAIVAVLAWSRPAVLSSQPQATPAVLVVKGKNGSRQLVVLRQTAATTHTTTRTSPPPP
jgi:anti-sigma-K factor RskA